MLTSELPTLATGFLLGWSVAWPPGPINAEIARRASAGALGGALALLLGAGLGDSLWAIGVSLGLGLIFAAPLARLAMGIVSIALLLVLAFMFLKGALGAWRGPVAPAPPARTGGAFLLGATLALTSPWNVAFWIAAMGRPELAGAGALRLAEMVVAVIAGALTWGVIWATANAWLHRGLDGAARRWWTFSVELATGLLMLYFAYGSAVRLWAA